jgi:integrase/recombinase XerD
MYSADDLLFKFTEHLKLLNRSPATMDAYATNARLFLKTIDIPDVRQITTGVIEQYIAGLYDHRTADNKPYSLSTICVKIRSIKRFFEYLESANIIFIDPAGFIAEPQQSRGKIKDTLTAKEVKAILDQPNLGTLMGIRDRAIMEVFYSAGIRTEELCNLTVFDVDLTGHMLRVTRGKGRKDRVVPLGRHAVRFAKEYITRVRPHYTKKNRASRHLFVNYYGQPITTQVIAIMIRKYKTAAKIRKNVTAHTFRHTFATDLIKNGADIRAVQKMLGHADIRTTQMYIRSLGIDLKKAHTRTHPRERDKEPQNIARPQIERIKDKYERKL